MNWQYPFILVFIPVLLFFWFFYFRKLINSKLFPNASSLINENLMQKISIKKRKWKLSIGLLGLMILSIAASGPQVGTKVKPVERRGVDLVFALDVSTSMNAQDVKPSRLSKAKFELGQIIKNLKGDRVGIIVFAGSSFLYLPLTEDYEAAQLFLNSIDTQLISTQGTSLSTAIKTGISTYTNDMEKYKVLILLTDGEDHEGEAVALAKKAAKTGLVIHTIGVGSITGSLIPLLGPDGSYTEYKRDRQGRLITSKLNEDILVEIAEAGNGIYTRLDNRNTVHDEIMKVIDAMEKRTISTHEFSEFEDRFQIFGLIALICIIGSILITTRQRVNN